MENTFLSIPQMLMIGSTGRNSGKTTLSVAMISKWKNLFPIIGLKVTTIQDRDGKCQRGCTDCGICTNIKDDFEIVEELTKEGNKDTCALLSAGANKVYWIRVHKPHSLEAINNFMALIPENNIIICESNSLRNFVKPGAFIMLNKLGNTSIKKSACEVMDKADFIFDSDFKNNINMVAEKVIVKDDTSKLSIKIIN